MKKRGAFDQSPVALSEDECLVLLKSCDLGRIAFAIDSSPEILPVNYAIHEEMVVFRTAPGTKLNSTANAKVAFEVDDWDPELGAGWSVVVKGIAEDYTNRHDSFADRVRSASVRPVAPGSRWRWLAITPADISGRRFQVRPRRGRSRGGTSSAAKT